MIAALLEKITGKDDVERIAYKEDLQALTEYLKTRRLFFPKKPKRFLDASTFKDEEFIEMMRQETKDLGGDHVELWILETDGKQRLPAFSSQKKMENFSSKISQELNKVFALGCVEMLLADVIKTVDIDFVDLNFFSQKSWEIGVKKVN